MSEMAIPVGLVAGSEIPPERIAAIARAAETQGFSELWLAEDCFLTGGIAAAGIALGVTEHLPIGLGVVSAVTRHPALLAMEVATLARAFPGRLRPALGLGVPAWLDQMGLRPRSPLAAVRETVLSLRELLAGKRLETDGVFRFDGVQLSYPVTDSLPIQLGVAGPKMLQLSGAVADGTLLSVLSGTAYVRWAREQIAAGAKRANRKADAAAHPITVFAFCTISEDGESARAQARPSVAFYLAAGGANALTDAYGVSDELNRMIAAGGVAAVEREMPDQWVADLALAGTPDEVVAGIRQLRAAGADRIALFPTPADRADTIIDLVARKVLPALAGKA